MHSNAPREKLDRIPPNTRLNSWKDIAGYLHLSVRTVQRWEVVEGLPVHRHEHAKVGTVYAYAEELDAWLNGRTAPIVPRDEQTAKRVLVVPFRLIQADPGIEYLSFGLADAISASLSGFDSLRVRSSLMAAKYAGSTDLKTIAREAAVDIVLLGTLMRSGDQLRVTVQVVEAASGTILSSESTQASLQDVFQLADQVVARVVESLVMLT